MPHFLRLPDYRRCFLVLVRLPLSYRNGIEKKVIRIMTSVPCNSNRIGGMRRIFIFVNDNTASMYPYSYMRLYMLHSTPVDSNHRSKVKASPLKRSRYINPLLLSTFKICNFVDTILWSNLVQNSIQQSSYYATSTFGSNF